MATTPELSITPRVDSKRRILVVTGLVVLAIALRDHLVPSVVFAATNLWDITPIVLSGLLMTAVLTASGSIGILVKTFDGREGLAIVMVSLIGAVLPVCGITLLPLVIGLLSAGVPLAPVMAFLLSSAVTDPSMFAITVGTLGLSFAIGKTTAALGIGLLGGGHHARDGARRSLASANSPIQLARFTHNPVSLLQLHRGAVVFLARPRSSLGVQRDLPKRGQAGGLVVGCRVCCRVFSQAVFGPKSPSARLSVKTIRWQSPVAAIIGAPLYLDGYAALPFVRGLMDRGMADGAAMAFLISGGITSAWAAIPVFALFRLPVFFTYIVLAVTGSILAGWAYAFAVA